MCFLKLPIICLIGYLYYANQVYAAEVEVIAEVTEAPPMLPAEDLKVLTLEPQGHENTAERKRRQFGYPRRFGGGYGRPGFGYGRPGFGYGRPGFGRPGFGGGGGGFYGGGGGFQRTRVVTHTRVVNRVGGYGYGGGGYYG